VARTLAWPSLGGLPLVPLDMVLTPMAAAGFGNAAAGLWGARILSFNSNPLLLLL
jgi:hypothetical protein